MTDLIKPREFLRETIALRNRIEGEFLNLGARLHKIREEKLYEKEYEDFETFLQEMKISKSSASKLITVYETFVLRFDIPRNQLAVVGWSSLYASSRFATSQQKAEELVERAGLLTRTDLQRSLGEDGEGKNTCKHLDAYLVKKCPGCHNQVRVYE